MLISVRLKNIFSFKDLVSFSLVSGKSKHFPHRVKALCDGKVHVLSFSAIYGANASGKTNFIRALNQMGTLLLDGSPERMVDYSYHGGSGGSSYFEIDFEQAGRLYNYGFEFDYSNNRFDTEWLYELTSGKEELVFERDLLKGEINSKLSVSEEYESNFNTYLGEAKRDFNQTFVHIIRDKIYKTKTLLKEPFQGVLNVWRFFVFQLEPVFPNDSANLFRFFLSDDALMELSAFLSRYDTGIKCLKKKRMEPEEVRSIVPAKYIEETNENVSNSSFSSAVLSSRTNYIYIERGEDGRPVYYNIFFIHDVGGKEVVMNLSEESDGTRRVMELAPIVLEKEDAVYLVDELDRCLHPLLTVRFVKEFLEKASKSGCHSQLIATTHESLLMDLELLRRDEIWFVEKVDGHSELYSLEDFQERFDKKADKSYLCGRYGAIPHFQDALGGVAGDED